MSEFLPPPQSSLAAVSLVLGARVLRGVIRLRMVFAVALAFGTLTALDNPARLAFISEMVGRRLIRHAVTLNSTLVNVDRALGPIVAATPGKIVVAVAIDAGSSPDARSRGPLVPTVAVTASRWIAPRLLRTSVGRSDASRGAGVCHLTRRSAHRSGPSASRNGRAAVGSLTGAQAPP